VSERDELIAAAKARAEAPPAPEEWGYRVALEEEETFVGRWRGETVDEDNENRRIFLVWDEAGEPAFFRYYASLGRELDREHPSVGDTVVIYRAGNYKTQYDDEGERSGQSYGVTTALNDAPLPGEAALGSGQLSDDEDVPF
jgi:hypothetical protein